MNWDATYHVYSMHRKDGYSNTRYPKFQRSVWLSKIATDQRKTSHRVMNLKRQSVGALIAANVPHAPYPTRNGQATPGEASTIVYLSVKRSLEVVVAVYHRAYDRKSCRNVNESDGGMYISSANVPVRQFIYGSLALSLARLLTHRVLY